MGRASTASRSTGGSPISGPIGPSGLQPFGYDVGEQQGSVGVKYDHEKDEVSGGIGFDLAGGKNGGNSINPAGGSPFSPSSGKPPLSPKSGGIDLGKGGRGIDLAKDAMPDLGKKPGSAKNPIGVEIGGSPAGNLGIGVSVPLGSSPFQARGGIILDPKTGAPVGGQLGAGAGIGPIGASADVGIDEGGCIRFLTLAVGPFTRTFQENVCKPNSPPGDLPPPSSPTPSPSPSHPSNQPAGWYYWGAKGAAIPSGPKGDDGPLLDYGTVAFGSLGTTGAILNEFNGFWCQEIIYVSQGNPYPDKAVDGYFPVDAYVVEVVNESGTIRKNWSGVQGMKQVTFGEIQYYWSNSAQTLLPRFVPEQTPGGEVLSVTACSPLNNHRDLAVISIRDGKNYITYYKDNSIDYSNTKFPFDGPLATRKKANPPLPNTPLPNTPPQKNMDADCCQFLANLIAAHGMNISNLLGQEVDLLAQTKKPIFPGEITRIKTPKDPRTPTEEETIKFFSYLDLINYLLAQSINLDVALDPQGWNLIPDGENFMNPKYQRPSDFTLKENKEPPQDKQGEDRVLKVGDKIFFPSVLAEQRWMFEKLKQLDYLFPPGELADAKISKDLLMPGQKGELKIFNMIHAYEILLQYLSAILGDPREAVFLKDSNPAKPGDQPVTISHMSISHLIREMYKFILDTEGDVDALVMMGLRDFRTNLANRVQIVQIAEMVEALFEDSGMLEKQQYIKLALEGDPYAGQWQEGQGFTPDPELDKDTEEATEAVLAKTLNNTELKIKVSRRDPKEKTDMRDLLVELAKTVMRQNSIPATPEAVQKAIESAEFKTKVDMALIRQQVKLAQAQSRPRTRKKRKK